MKDSRKGNVFAWLLRKTFFARNRTINPVFLFDDVLTSCKIQVGENADQDRNRSKTDSPREREGGACQK